MIPKTKHRPLSTIARDIFRAWPNMYFGAVPYAREMALLDDINSPVMPSRCEDGRTMVLYFLANAKGWRGDTARAIKAELKGML